MDKPKESKIRTRVMEILRNHDQEARVIEAQIAAEKETLEADLEFILESAYPSSQLSDAGVRVQSSPDPDGRLVRMVDKRDRRRQRANEAIGNLKRQLQQITEVQDLVYFDSLAKTWDEQENLVVRVSQIETKVLNVEDVIDITGTKINGGTQNISLASNAIPVLGVVTNGS